MRISNKEIISHKYPKIKSNKTHLFCKKLVNYNLKNNNSSGIQVRLKFKIVKRIDNLKSKNVNHFVSYNQFKKLASFFLISKKDLNLNTVEVVDLIKIESFDYDDSLFDTQTHNNLTKFIDNSPLSLI